MSPEIPETPDAHPSGPAVYTIPAGVPFVDALAAGILDRLANGEEGEKGEERAGGAEKRAPEKVALEKLAPEKLAGVTVLLPTRRACRSLREAFLRLSDGRPLLLPRLTPLGDVDEDDIAFAGWQDGEAGSEAGESLEIPPAISGLRRQLLLSRLILPFRQGRMTPDQAARLAAELAGLLDQVQLERLDFHGLKDLVPDTPKDLAEHWQKTLGFLEILTRSWPAILAEEGCIDPAQRRNLLLQARARQWAENPPAGPVIAAGSTGSIPATADLLKVVANLPRGAVVLPGFDAAMDPETIEVLPPSHPQFGMAQLVAHLEIEPAKVRPWPASSIKGADDSRFKVIAGALHPTGLPIGKNEGVAVNLAAAAFTGVSRVDCPSPREEAGVIALAMREALATEGKRAALITPDRTLARQVQTELKRWGIAVDDSAGTPLSKTPPGSFLRLTAALIAEQWAPVPLMAAFKHPLAAGGEAPAAFRARSRFLERKILRGPRPSAGVKGLLEAIGQVSLDEIGLKNGSRKELQNWIGDVARMAAPFTKATGTKKVSLVEILQAHVTFAEALAATPEEDGRQRLWSGEAGEAAAGFIADLALAARDFPPMEGSAYGALLDSLIAGRVVRSTRGHHPRLAIWGLLEARLQQADLLILGGLNEGTWPPRTDTGPWMSRPMRKDFGLPQPERRIGLATHDFVQALAAPEVLITRATRVEGAPTLPSRWLLRLDNLLKAGGAAGMPRADRYLAWLDDLDRPERPTPWGPPQPKPPVQSRPRELSVTRIETWIRDPYALYADRILGLAPLDPLDADPAAAERGIIIHRVLERFLKAYPLDLPEDGEEKLLEMGRRVFGGALTRPGVRAFWWPRFERIAHWIIAFEKDRRAQGHVTLATEAKGSLEIAAPAGPFILTTRADRIDRLAGGGLTIMDYKTGAPPSWPQVKSGLAPQLPLEAAIAAQGGFEGVPAAPVEELAYVRLSGGRVPGKLEKMDEAVAETTANALAGLIAFAARFDDENTPYVSRRIPMLVRRTGDYDHLARVKEWSAGAGDEE